MRAAIAQIQSSRVLALTGETYLLCYFSIYHVIIGAFPQDGWNCADLAYCKSPLLIIKSRNFYYHVCSKALSIINKMLYPDRVYNPKFNKEPIVKPLLQY